MIGLFLLLAMALLAVSSLAIEPVLAFVGFGCVLAATLLWGKQSALSLVSPVVLLQLSALFYSILLPISKIAGWQVHISRASLIRTEAFDEALMLSLGSAVAMLFGAYIARTKWMPGLAPVRPVASQSFVISAWALLIVGGGATFLLLTLSGGVEHLSALSYGARYLAVAPVSFLKYGPVLLAFSVAAFYYDMQSRRTPWHIVGVGFAVAILLLDATVMERRTPTYIAIIGVLVIRVLSGGSRRAWSLAVVGVALVLAVPVTSHLRGGGDLYKMSMDRANPASYEFGGPYLTLVDIVRRVTESDELQFGHSYIAAVGVLVPRALWSERPMSLPEWYVNTYYKSMAQTGGGLAFSPVAEAYMNFGLAGVLGFFLCVGALAARFERFLALQIVADRRWVVGYAFFAPWLFLFYRLDFGSFLKLGILYTLLLFIFLRVVDRAFGYYRNVSHGRGDGPAGVSP